MEFALLENIGQFGLAVSLVAFFLWRDWMRESSDTKQRLADSNERKELQRAVNETLVVLHTRTLDALSHNTDALRSLQETLGTRPCLLPLEARAAAENQMTERRNRGEK